MDGFHKSLVLMNLSKKAFENLAGKVENTIGEEINSKAGTVINPLPDNKF